MKIRDIFFLLRTEWSELPELLICIDSVQPSRNIRSSFVVTCVPPTLTVSCIKSYYDRIPYIISHRSTPVLTYIFWLKINDFLNIFFLLSFHHHCSSIGKLHIAQQN